jgi:ABC-type sugar transport system permease subunit
MKLARPLLFLLLAVAVGAIGLTVRYRAVDQLPLDYDEPVYLGVAQRYAQWLNDGNIRAIVNYEFNYEHPPLSKLTYGLMIRGLPTDKLLPEIDSTQPRNLEQRGDMPQLQFDAARRMAAVFGALQVFALALLDPLAALLLAFSTWQIKYTSQIMLEPLPSLMSTVMVVAYIASQQLAWSRRPWLRWLPAALLALSAVAFGLTESSKFTYGVAGVALLVDWLLHTRPDWPADSAVARLRSAARWLLPAFAWVGMAIAVFVASNPRMWVDPLPRLTTALLYHGAYTQSQNVQSANFPLWQPFVWLFQSVPWHPGVFYVGIDFGITLLAALGFRSLWQRQRVMALWLVIGLGFLLVWPTKWPQYILTITVPWTVSAAEGLRMSVWQPLLAWIRKVRSARRLSAPATLAPGERAARRRESVEALPWLLPGLLTLALLAVFPLVFQVVVSLTDFNLASIKDGMNGGVFRAVWEGLTGQAKPIADAGQALAGHLRSRTVNWTGPGLIVGIASGAGAGILVFNLVWVVLSVGLQTVVGFTAALLLNGPRVRFASFWRIILILPWAIPEFIGALVWMRIYEPRYGWLALANSDLPWYIYDPKWFQQPNATLGTLLLAATWYGFPLIMLAATAGLKLIPREVYDAAAVDGAGGWSRIRYVTWPLLLPLVIPAIIIRMIFAFNQFYLFYAMQTSQPTLTMATLSFYYFQPLGFFGGQFAVSAAINVFAVLVLIVTILWLDRRRTVPEGVTYA